jgi:large subunit ribosomal protein L29
MKTASTYRDLTVEELRARETDMRRSLFNLRTRATTKELQDVSRIRAEKRELARILTVIRQKETAK